MKIALIADTHFAAREGRAIFHDYFEKFYRDIFFPICNERNISKVIHLGDVFDRRKYIDFYSLKRSKEYFFDHLRKFETYVILGNHDIAMRNSLEINSPSLVLEEYDNIKIIKEPTLEDNILMIPWICSENKSECFDAIKTQSSILFGHFEIKNFQMYAGVKSKDGIEQNIFNRFNLVCSGHYHHRSSNNNIKYLGSPYEITHMDYGSSRGFHILDTETEEIEFIQNPYTMFEKIVYDDTENNIDSIDVSHYKEKFVKIIIKKKTDFYKFDLFLQKVFSCGAHDVKIIESITEIETEEINENVDINDTLTILERSVFSTETTVDKNDLFNYVKTLYIEAINSNRNNS